MNRYTVLWSHDAEDQLADAWLQAQDRQAVTVAQARIDQELAADAETKGIDLGEGLRLLKVPPLKAFFEVSEPDRIVRVTAIGTLS